MRLHFTFVAAALASSTAAEVFKFPLPNGFPNIQPGPVLTAIEYQAGGPLPAAGTSDSELGADTKLPKEAAQALQGLAFNELFEVAFFTQLLQNVTQSKPGFKLGSDYDLIVASLNSSQAQEELHALNANMGLAGSGYAQVKPCEYEFPVNSFSEAMDTADDFAMLLMAAISSVIVDFGSTPQIVNLFSSVLGQEGQQDGYLRWLKSVVPNENPFLTSTTLSYVYSHIHQHFVVPGTCPQQLNFPIYNRLTPLESPPAKNTTISFSTTQPHVNSTYSIAYMSGQNLPVVVSLSKITEHGDLTTLEASFPFEAGFSRGLTVAALVHGSTSFGNVSQVADKTVAGPAVIQVNYD